MNTVLVRSLVVFTFVLLAATASGQTNAVPASTNSATFGNAGGLAPMAPIAPGETNAVPASASPASGPTTTSKAPENEPPPLPPARENSDLVDELQRLDEAIARIVMRLDYNQPELVDAGRQQLYRYLRTHRVDKKVKAVLGRLKLFKTNVEINFTFIAFPSEEVEAMARKIGAPSPSEDQLKQAWASGRGRLLATSKVVTVPGQQAKVEGVQEIIYPTEYQSPQGSVSATNATHATIGSIPPASPAAGDLRWFPIPGQFQTRNVGTTVNVTPLTKENSSLIYLTFIPELVGIEWTTLKESTREASQAVDTAFQQPAFHTHRVMTSMPMLDGETLVTYGGLSKTGREQIYVFVNASTDLVVPEPPDTTASGKNRLTANTPRSSAPQASGLRKDNAGPRASKTNRDDSGTQPKAATGTPTMRHKSFDGDSLPFLTTTAEQGKQLSVSVEDVKRFFIGAGIPFPPGSSITYSKREKRLFVTNTPENLEAIDMCLKPLDGGNTRRYVEVTSAFVAFPLKEVENMARKSADIAPTQEQIKHAWANGKGKLLATARIKTIYNLMVRSETVKEITYPAAYQISKAAPTEPPSPRSTGNGGGKSGVKGEKPDPAKNVPGPTPASRKTRATNNPGTLLIPKDLQTRNVGTIMVAKVEAETDERIGAILILELSDVKWMTIGASMHDGQQTTRLTLDQPVFHTQRITAGMALPDGGTVVTGGMLNRSGTEVTYALISTKTITIDGSPQPCTEDRKP